MVRRLAVKRQCTACGKQTEGHAYIGPDAYCHGDGDGPTCYEAAILNRSRLAEAWGLT
jgi:hypothetical protein